MYIPCRQISVSSCFTLVRPLLSSIRQCGIFLSFFVPSSENRSFSSLPVNISSKQYLDITIYKYLVIFSLNSRVQYKLKYYVTCSFIARRALTFVNLLVQTFEGPIAKINFVLHYTNYSCFKILNVS